MKKILHILVLTVLASPLMAQSYRIDQTESNKRAPLQSGALGKNIISLMPMQIMAMNLDDDGPDFTVGLSYERIFNNELISFRLPLSISLTKPNYYYLMPTLKLFPKKQGIVKFAVGPQFLFAYGNDEYVRYVNSPSGGYSQTVEDVRKQFGFLINNNVNFTFSRNVYLALDYSLGIKYYDNFPNEYNSFSPFGSESNIAPVFQLNFNMGVRF